MDENEISISSNTFSQFNPIIRICLCHQGRNKSTGPGPVPVKSWFRPVIFAGRHLFGLGVRIFSKVQPRATHIILDLLLDSSIRSVVTCTVVYCNCTIFNANLVSDQPEEPNQFPILYVSTDSHTLAIIRFP